jgi:ABC-2 type transport system ATP-binding protein
VEISNEKDTENAGAGAGITGAAGDINAIKAGDEIIKVSNVTKNYGPGRGLFNVTLSVQKGEIFGFLGPNGAGKTTMIRHLLGFCKPQNGSCFINDLDCWRAPAKIQKHLGYVAGEIALPDNLKGNTLIKEIAAMKKMTNTAPAMELCKYFKLDPNSNLKRMSKGTKQKIALVLAFMDDPDIYILDEPTSGLDPLMQARFCDLVAKKRAEGKTFFLSSHSFDEVEKTCDRVAIIKQGEIIASINMKEIEHRKDKEFEIRFLSKPDCEKFAKSKLYTFNEVNPSKNRVKVVVNDKDINTFTADIAKYKIEYISEIKFTLEKFFMTYYTEETTKEATK